MPVAAIAAIGIGSAIAGGVGSSTASKQQARAALEGAQQNWNMYQSNRADLAPYRDSGAAADYKLSQLLGIGTPGASAGLSADEQKRLGDAQASLQWYQDVMAGKGSGGWKGGAPTNPGTISKFQSQIQQLQSTVNQLQDKQKMAAATEGSNTNDFGSLMHDFSAADFKTEPGYDFRLQQGDQALERSAAARGGVLGAGTLKDLTQYNQNFASNEFQNAYNRYQQNRATKFGQLYSLSGLGASAAGQTAQLGANAAARIGDLQTQAGNAEASGTMGIANSISQAMQSGLDAYMYSQGSRTPNAPTVNSSTVPISTLRNPGSSYPDVFPTTVIPPAPSTSGLTLNNLARGLA
jgi:hypothetical protein